MPYLILYCAKCKRCFCSLSHVVVLLGLGKRKSFIFPHHCRHRFRRLTGAAFFLPSLKSDGVKLCSTTPVGCSGGGGGQRYFVNGFPFLKMGKSISPLAHNTYSIVKEWLMQTILSEKKWNVSTCYPKLVASVLLLQFFRQTVSGGDAQRILFVELKLFRSFKVACNSPGSLTFSLSSYLYTLFNSAAVFLKRNLQRNRDKSARWRNSEVYNTLAWRRPRWSISWTGSSCLRN